MNNKENLLPTVMSDKTPSTMQAYLEPQWQRVTRRRSFLKNLGIFSATLSAAPLLTLEGRAEHRQQKRSSSSSLPDGDVAILKLLAAAEILESDLWSQYAELSGAEATTFNEQFQGFIGWKRS